MLDGEYPPADATTDFNHPLHASENGTAFDHETTLREHVPPCAAGSIAFSSMESAPFCTLDLIVGAAEVMNGRVWR